LYQWKNTNFIDSIYLIRVGFIVQGKGSVQFPDDRPISFDLIGRNVKFRINENILRTIQRT